MKIHNERRKTYIKDLHIQDMLVIYDGRDSKVQDQCYKAERLTPYSAYCNIPSQKS